MKRLIVKDWLFQKIAKENNVGRIWSGNVDCIFGETEKAYHVIMGAVNKTVITWIPKSQCEWSETDNEFNQTVVYTTFEDAMERVNDLRMAF